MPLKNLLKNAIVNILGAYPMKRYLNLIISILILIILIGFDTFYNFLDLPHYPKGDLVDTIQKILIIALSSLIIVELVHIIKIRILKRYDITMEDNLKSRKIYTQMNLLEKIIVFLIIITAIGLILISIDSIKEIGVGLFASAGVVGIILGLSAQKIVGALLAGFQIAITQPFRLDDAVVVENEWGWIEEINLTYIVVRLWDKRRLVLPTTYFLENPFQNWTRTNADIMGTVFIYTDYKISFDALREELTRLLNSSELWDRKVNVLQVTDSKETTVEIRILVSAKNSPTAWDLRVFIREKMIDYIQKNYPECLPRTRVILEKDEEIK